MKKSYKNCTAERQQHEINLKPFEAVLNKFQAIATEKGLTTQDQLQNPEFIQAKQGFKSTFLKLRDINKYIATHHRQRDLRENNKIGI